MRLRGGTGGGAMCLAWNFADFQRNRRLNSTKSKAN